MVKPRRNLETGVSIEFLVYVVKRLKKQKCMTTWELRTVFLITTSRELKRELVKGDVPLMQFQVSALKGKVLAWKSVPHYYGQYLHLFVIWL